MGRPLTIVQLDALRAQIGNDPTAVYTQLRNLGYRYADLAYGVVSQSYLSGRIAQDFANNSAASQGHPLSQVENSQIKVQLAQAYIDSLKALVNAGRAGSDINFLTAYTFHASVFASHGLSDETWTLTAPYKLVGLSYMESNWPAYTSASSLQQLQASGSLFFKVEAVADSALIHGDFATYWRGVRWQSEVSKDAAIELGIDSLRSIGRAGYPLSPASFQSYDGSTGLLSFAPAVTYSQQFRQWYLAMRNLADQFAESEIPLRLTVGNPGLLAQRSALADQWVGYLQSHQEQIKYNVKPDGTPSNSSDSVAYGQIAAQFGSTLGRLIGGSSLVIGTATGTVISSVALTIGQQLFGAAYSPNANTPGGASWGTGSIWQDFGNNLSYLGTNAAIGSVSGYLAAEFSQSIGLSGFGGRLFSTVTSNVLQYELTQLVAQSGIVGNLLDKAALTSFGDALTSGIAGFIGVELASLIVTPHTVAESTLASLGSAVGTIVAATDGSLFGLIGLPAGPVGIAIAAFVGFILGDLIGSLFGGHRPRVPTAAAEVVLQIPLAQYALGTETSADGGNLQLADAMAKVARDTLNGIIGQITGGAVPSFVSNTFSPTQTYGVTGNVIYVKLSGVETDTATADLAVNKGVLWALPQTKIIGGDIVLKRAIALTHSSTITELLGELQIAKDYETYLSSRPIIDAAISSSWNGLSAADKAFYTANKAFMTRAISATQLALTGADITFYNANKTQVDRIVSGISVSSFAAGWIVTLARAAELGLGNFGASDFFGGLQGFAQSFGAAATGTGSHYEDITATLNGGNLTITASGSSAAGTFSLLPQASADGSSVTIAGFGANVGYTVQAIGTITAGNDFESAAGSATAVSVGPGSPAIYAYPYVNIPATNTGDDIIIGSNAGDSLSAGAGNVWIDGGDGNDGIYGGAGRDVLIGGSGNDGITAGAGDTYLSGGTGDDTLTGGVGNDIFVGGTGTNRETGGTGNDVFIYNLGETDTIDGGGGSNTLSFERRTAGVSFGLTGAAQALDGGSIVNIQNLTGSEFNDSLTDGPAGGTLRGLGGNDNLQGGAGNDILEGGAGADIIAGNGGNNTASYSASSTGVYVSIATGTTIGGDATGDVLTNIQNLTGSANGDELAGDAGVNIINAGAGDDWIDATVGADTYNGGDGFDTVDYSLMSLAAGTGTAYYYYNGVTYPYTTTIPALSVTLGAGNNGSATYRATDGTSLVQSLTSIEQVIGSASNDSFSSSGSAINVTWDGNGGADTFYGGTGSDTYIFGSGYGVSTITDTKDASNTIRMKSGVTFDSLWAANSGGNLQIGIRGEAGYVQVNGDFATAGNDVVKTLDLAGAGQVDLTAINAVAVGSDGADTINGSYTTGNLIFAYNGNDTINASSGILTTQGSVIDGGLGNDIINSSTGDDEFLFERGDGQDVINDAGGINTIVFGPTVGANDVIYQVVGNDLYVGIKDLTNTALTASQVADYMKIVGGGVRYGNGRFPIPISVIAGGATTDLRKANIAWTRQVDPNRGGGGGNRPIILDLTGDGLELTSVSQSDIVTKDANGNVLRSGWVGPTNGILAVDRNGDGRINNTADVSFVHDKAGATTDLQGLAGWDTNVDGVIDAKDRDFKKLVVWVDANQNGRDDVGEVKTLDQLGISSIALAGKATGFDGSDSNDSVIFNTTTFTRTSGATGAAYDVSFATQLLAGLYGSTDGLTIDASAPATFGKLTNDPLALAAARGLTGAALTEGALSALATVDVTSTTGTISRVDAVRWADLIDPTRIQARRDFLANRMSGAEYLDAIRSISAGNPNILTGRGARDQKTRLQAVVIDFNRNGADLIDAKKSHALVDVMHSGEVAQVGWVKGSDGILAYDRNGDGFVDPGTEVSFLGDVPNARTAIQGLGAFDTNKDGTIDANDTSFGKFLIWRDQNGNGVSDIGEVQSLAQAGVQSIQLSGAKVSTDRGAGSTNDVLGVSKIAFTDGSTRAIYDVALGYADSKEDNKSGNGSAIGSNSNSQAATGNTSGTSTPSSTASGQATAKLGANTVSTVGLSRGALDGPSGLVVEANGSASGDTQWWRNASIVGQGLAALASGFANNDQALGANRSSAVGDGVTDAATLQRLMLLRQNIASLQPASGGSAAIWGHDAANDRTLLAASALPTVSATPLRTGTGG